MPLPTPHARWTRWAHALTAATLGVLVAAGSITGAVVVPDDAPYQLVGKSADRSPVRVATYNVRTDVPAYQAREAVHRLLPYADVIGLQEFESETRTPILAELEASGWGYWKASGADPILYDTAKFRFLAAKVVKLAEAETVEDPENGYRRVKETRPSYATVVRLWHTASARRVTVIDVHLIAGATRDGRPDSRAPVRAKVYQREMAAVADLVAAQPGRVTVYAVGDWNVAYNLDARAQVRTFPYRRFRHAGYESVWATQKAQRPTFGTQGVIDGVWAKRPPARAVVLSGFPESDHRPVVATYKLTVTDNTAPPPPGDGTGGSDPEPEPEPDPEPDPDDGCTLIVVCD